MKQYCPHAPADCNQTTASGQIDRWTYLCSAYKFKTVTKRLIMTIKNTDDNDDDKDDDNESDDDTIIVTR